MHAHQARGIDSVRRARSGATKAQASEMMERHGGIPGDSIRDFDETSSLVAGVGLGSRRAGPGQHLFCGRRAEP